MKRVFIFTALFVGGYIAGAIGAAVAVELLSPNTHDRSVESAMTGAFVTGPIGAVLGLIVGWLVTRLRSSA